MSASAVPILAEVGDQVGSSAGASDVTLALWVSLLAVVLSPVIQWLVARLAFRASVLSANRQAWIDGLRGHLSEFVSHATFIWMRMHSHFRAAGDLDPLELASLLRELSRHKYRVVLMLNLEEEAHEELESQLGEIVELLSKGGVESGTDSLDDVVMRLVNNSRTIFKDEWERVKKGH